MGEERLGKKDAWNDSCKSRGLLHAHSDNMQNKTVFIIVQIKLYV